MPKNVMKLIKPSPHRGRNDFDLSHRHIYGAQFGELLPVTQIETVPGDHIEISIANLLRAMPLATSPFMRAKQHLDVWFVPYRDLWHNFDNFITKKEQPVSSALKGSLYCPNLDLYNISQSLNATILGNTTDIIGQTINVGCKKIYDLLGYGRDTFSDGSSVSGKVNIFRVLAYNYIWYNEYRNKYYDDGSWDIPSSVLNNYNIASIFNMDALSCTSLSTADPSLSLTTGSTTDIRQFIQCLFQMRYRQWKKDLYTGLLPSTQFGAVSAVTSSNVTSNSLRFLKVGGSSVTDGPVSFGTSGSTPGLLQDSDASNVRLAADQLKSSVDILALRKAEALQIWRENALRAGNRVSDNMMAHYGIESDFRDHRPIFLGSVDSPVNISDIDATAQTGNGGNQLLGSIGGKGLSSLSDRKFKFDAKDFGVIMVMHSILPEAEYNSDGCDRNNQLLEAEDFFVPEYENLGLESVSTGNFYMKGGAQSVIGYAPRYYGYKQKMDKCFGAFRTGGIFAPWTSPRSDLAAIIGSGAPTQLPLRNLYVDPAIFQNNFAVNSIYQFLCDTYFDVDAVRPMTVMGLPAGV